MEHPQVIPKTQYEIKAIRWGEKTIDKMKLSNGSVVNVDQAAQLALEGLLKNIAVEIKPGKDVTKNLYVVGQPESGLASLSQLPQF